MHKKLFLISCAVLLLAAVPQYVILKDGDSTSGDETPPATLAALRPEPGKPVAHYASGVRKVSLELDKSGHFSGDFRLNGRPVNGLIDTGATYIAMNEKTARSIGIRLSASDFSYGVRTANGTTKAAKVVLDRVDIGIISVTKVEAFILTDDALSTTLVGMSFMSKLSSYKVNGGTLEMVN